MTEEKRRSVGGKMIKDIGIYAIGNLGSKLLTFLLVPLYTYYIRPADYGYYDLCMTAAFLLMPFLSLSMRDGAFRFLIESDSEKGRKAVVTYVYKTLAVNSTIAIAAGVFVAIFYPIEYLWLVIGLLIAMSCYEVIIQVARGLGETKYFVMSGIISSLFIGLLSIALVVWLDMGIVGIFLANIGARFIAILFLEWRLHIVKKYFGLGSASKRVNKEILKYCLPLLPGSICWWLVGSSNKFFIEHYIGLAGNGQYAVALKFASILETLAFIFYQAWQETALRQYDTPDRDRIFSKIMNNYIFFLSSLVMLFSFFLKMNYGWLVSEEYAVSVNYLYPLALSAMFFSLSAFFDMGYQCSKKTVLTLPGIVLASIVNVACNYFLIQRFAVYGVVASSIMTFATLYIYRSIDTRKFFKISYSPRLIVSLCLLVVSGIAFYTIDSTKLDIAYFVVLALVLILLAPRDVKDMVVNKLLKR